MPQTESIFMAGAYEFTSVAGTRTANLRKGAPVKNRYPFQSDRLLLQKSRTRVVPRIQTSPLYQGRGFFLYPLEKLGLRTAAFGS